MALSRRLTTSAFVRVGRVLGSYTRRGDSTIIVHRTGAPLSGIGVSVKPRLCPQRSTFCWNLRRQTQSSLRNPGLNLGLRHLDHRGAQCEQIRTTVVPEKGSLATYTPAARSDPSTFRKRRYLVHVATSVDHVRGTVGVLHPELRRRIGIDVEMLRLQCASGSVHAEEVVQEHVVL